MSILTTLDIKKKDQFIEMAKEVAEQVYMEHEDLRRIRSPILDICMERAALLGFEKGLILVQEMLEGRSD